MEKEDIERTKLKQENEELKQEIQSLKDEIEGMWTIPQKYSEMANKNQVLTAQLHQSEQKCLEFQRRLKNAEEKLAKKESDILAISTLKKEAPITEIQSQKLADSIIELEKAKQDNIALTSQEKSFFAIISKLLDADMSSFDDIISKLSQYIEDKNSEVQKATEKTKHLTKDVQLAIQTTDKKIEKLTSLLESTTEELNRTQAERDKHLDEIELLESKIRDQSSASLIKIEELNEELNTTKASLTQLTIKYDSETSQLKKLLDQKTARVQELNERLLKPANTGEDQINQLVAESSRLKQENEELQQKYQATASSANQLRSKCNSLKVDNEKLSRQLSNSKKTIDLLKGKLRTKLDESSHHGQQLDKLSELTDQLQSENEILHSQLKAAQTQLQNSSSLIKQKDDKIAQLSKAISTSEELLRKQGDEMKRIHEERDKIVSLLFRQAELLQTMRQLPSNTVIETQTKTKIQREMPDISMRLISLLPLDQQASAQRIVASLDPISKVIVLFKTYIRTDTEEEVIQPSTNCHLVEGVISSLKNLLANDQDLKTFICSNMEYLEKAIKEDNGISTLSVQMSYLYNASYEERRRVIEAISKDGWTNQQTFDLFSMMALSNIALERALKNNKAQNQDTVKLCKMLKSGNICESVKELITALENERLKASRSKEKIKELQRGIQEIPILNKKIEDKKTECETLRDHLSTASNDIATLEKNLSRKVAEVESLKTALSSAEKSFKENETRFSDEIIEFENAIEERNREVQQLKTQLIQQKAEYERQLMVLQSSNETHHQEYLRKADKWKSSLEKMRAQKEKIELQIERKLTAQARQNQLNLNQLKQEIKMLTEEKDRLEAKESEYKREIEKLSQEAELNMDKIKELSATKVKLGQEIRKLEKSSKATEYQMKREIEVLKTQTSFQKMSTETRHQEEVELLKNQIEAEKTALMIDTLGDFDAISSDTISEREFRQTIRQLSIELFRLRRNQ